MFEIEVDGVFAQPVEEVFDFLADFRNELNWNPDTISMEKVSSSPIGVGTRFSGKFKRVGRIDSEFTLFQRPIHFAEQDKARGMTGLFDFRFAPAEDGTRLSLRVRMQPHGPLRLFQPVLRRMMSREFAHLPSRMQDGLNAATSRRDPPAPLRGQQPDGRSEPELTP